MQFGFVYAYALDASPEIAAKAKAILPVASFASATDKQKNDVLALVLVDEFSFASAAWFYTRGAQANVPAGVLAGDGKGCSATVVAGLKSGSLDGWKAFLKECVGVEADADRHLFYERALAAF